MQIYLARISYRTVPLMTLAEQLYEAKHHVPKMLKWFQDRYKRWNDIPLLYMDLITNPCFNPRAVVQLTSVSKRGPRLKSLAMARNLLMICNISSQGSWGPHGAHLGPVGPRWVPCRPHEPCYLGCHCDGYSRAADKCTIYLSYLDELSII